MEEFTARDKITKARVKLQKDNPFFSYLVMSLQIHEKEDTGTCAVDCKGNLYYNPKWVDKLTIEETKTLLAHEVLHVALLHLIRKGERDMKGWNIASDIIVNNLLVLNEFVFTGEMSHVLLPKYNSIDFLGFVIGELDKKSSEEVYSLLQNKFGKNEQSEAGQGFDEHIYGKAGETDENGNDIQNKVEREWRGKMAEAVVYAKSKGKGVCGFERAFSEILNSKMNWKQILHRYISDSIPFDYTYSKPSRRSFSMGIYQPKMKKEALDIVTFIDVSGSIQSKELQEFVSELVGIGKSFDNINMEFITWDTKANNRYQLNKSDINDISELKINGGGGTDFTKVYDYLDENSIRPKIIIFFTDGYADYPNEERYKTLWVLNENSCPVDKIPFGEVIKL